MDKEQIISIRIVMFFIVTLLLPLRFPQNLATGYEIQSMVCGADRIEYSDAVDAEIILINGNVVDKDSICKALRFYVAVGCISADDYHRIQCRLDSSSANLHLKKSRKLLQKELKDTSAGYKDGKDSAPKHRVKDSDTISMKHIGVIATGIVAMCCGVLCPCIYKRRKASSHTVLSKDPVSMDSISSLDSPSVHDKVPPSPLRVPPSPSRFAASPKLSRLGSVHVNLSQVARATHNFSSSLRIGEGGFGTVYKAHLDDGQIVAIKRAKKETFENLRTEFSSEVELLAKIDHRNLVKLLGYVDTGDERLLITEYVSNGTLREHLDGQRGKILDFNQRLEIAIDVAHALTYLHLYAEKQIIHRDVKSSNILLTESMRAKVADFGFARLGSLDSEQTHISTKVKGTVGYLDPEYMRTYQLTPMSDVYSFGILLLEILTGRRPVELKRPVAERVTLRWAFQKYNEYAVVEMVDPLMEEEVGADILRKMATLAIRCAAPVKIDRPDMKAVGEELWGIRSDYLKTSKRPGY
ncbi:Calmodulin-binding receptor-like cytoplasmic kinase 3 [Linum perenne]